jgi:hypothetical protein
VSQGDWIVKGENGETYNARSGQIAPDLDIRELAHPTRESIANQDRASTTASRSKFLSRENVSDSRTRSIESEGRS